jgi:predicted metal-dependent phosphoesterase TrpH
MRLKCDLHLHTAEDPRHNLQHTARDIIDAAADRGYEIMSITNHNTITWSPELAAYADERGILLIPGVEATVMGKHVLIYGVTNNNEDWENLTFFDLKRLKARGAFVVAPHPFYPNYNCLGGLLERFAGLFDAVEYSHLYTNRFNFNNKAQKFASRYNMPILGQSDAHRIEQLDYTFSVVRAPEKSQEAVFSAIKEGKATVVTRPAKMTTTARMGVQLFATFLALQVFK